MSVTFTAERNGLVEITEAGPDEGSRWLGRAGKARRINLDASAPEEQPTETLVGRCQELEELMIKWLKLVRSTKRERTKGQLERLLVDLGPLPEVDHPSERALWIAGLINPLPALGVALEIRPAVQDCPAQPALLPLHRTRSAGRRPWPASFSRLGGRARLVGCAAPRSSHSLFRVAMLVCHPSAHRSSWLRQRTFASGSRSLESRTRSSGLSSPAHPFESERSDRATTSSTAREGPRLRAGR